MKSRSLSSVTIIKFISVLFIYLSPARAESDAESPRKLLCTLPVIANRSSCSSNDCNTLKCPEGDEVICGGGNCPLALSCKFDNCSDFANFCWGSTVCDDETVCPDLDDIFCSGEKSNPKNFSVCRTSQIVVHSQISSDIVGLKSSLSLRLANSAEIEYFPDDTERTMLGSASISKGISHILLCILWHRAFINIKRFFPTKSYINGISFYVLSLYS